MTPPHCLQCLCGNGILCAFHIILRLCRPLLSPTSCHSCPPPHCAPRPLTPGLPPSVLIAMPMPPHTPWHRSLLLQYERTIGDLHVRGIVTFVGFTITCGGDYLMMFTGKGGRGAGTYVGMVCGCVWMRARAQGVWRWTRGSARMVQLMGALAWPAAPPPRRVAQAPLAQPMWQCQYVGLQLPAQVERAHTFWLLPHPP